MSRRLLALVSLFVTLSSTALADAREFTITEGGGSRVQFTSDAPLERMTGTSSSASGSFTVDPSALSTARGRVDVPVSSIRTGITLRDGHLRSDSWLDAARFPNASFELDRVSGATALVEGQETRVTLHGRFTVHGQSKNVTATARISWSGSTVRVRARFTIRLTDHGVSIPSVVELKVSNTIVVDVALVATTRS